MFSKIKAKIASFAVETKEKAEQTLDETKENVAKLTKSADKFISDSNNQMKVITIAVVGVGTSIILSNIVNMFTTIYNVKHSKAPQITQNFYINKGEMLCKDL